MIERRLAYFLVNVSQDLITRPLKEEDIENCDKIHFVINYGAAKTLVFRGDEEVRCAHATLGGDGMTMTLYKARGPHFHMANPFMKFKKQDIKFLIRVTPDNIPVVSYYSGPKGWVDKLWSYSEWRNASHWGAYQRVQWEYFLMDSCSRHTEKDELRQALSKVNIEVKFFPANATDLVQPADSFIIQKFKAAWSKRW